MTKQISFSHISVYKTEFDLLYQNYIKSTDLQKLQTTIERMTHLQDKIVQGIDRAPVNLSRYFSWSAPAADTSVNAEEIKSDVQSKLASMLSHSSNIGQQSLSNRVSPITTPPSTPPEEIDKSKKPELKATDFAVGFENASANCWANSLLSMILSMPSFRRAYETVANHYANDNVNELNHKHGHSLLNALKAYDNALQLKKAVPASVTQDVRLAFNYFFGHRNPQTFHEIFSKSSSRHEDAWEAMQVLMGRYEQILRDKHQLDPIQPPYSHLLTKRHYRPMGTAYPADPEKVLRDDYSRLNSDNVSSVVNKDYQIILDLQNKGHLPFSALLYEYFCNTHSQGHDTGTYLLPDGQIQKFELIGEGRQFVQSPQELLLTIKRFGASMEGNGFKIATPLAVNQTLVLPPEATSENTPIAYELDAFNVHSGGFGGGHYIAYRKINGQWIEANDSFVRFVSNQEVDQILSGQKGPTFTSYMHHYSRVPQSRQQEMIKTASFAPLQTSSSEVDKLSKEKTDCEKIIGLLETLNTNPNEDSLKALRQAAPQVLTTLCHAVWVNDKTPDIYDYGTVTLNAHPEKLKEIQLPWLISPTGANLVEQMLIIHRKKLEIATEKLTEAKLLTFLEKLKNPSLSNENLQDALQRLPEKVQCALHGLVYHSHLNKFGKEHVNKAEYNNEYGRVSLEKGDIRKIFTEATESVLNLWGKNILEQLIAEHHLKAEKLQCDYEKEQLQGFHDLLLHSSNEISNFQLFKAFERLDVRNELKEKLYWHVWFGHRSPSIYNYGFNTLKDNPRALLGIREPNLAKPPLCASGSNILYQLIKLLEKESK